jgi:two-component system sensor histidine kinase BaeS
MRFGITSKLFATILVTNVAIAVAFGAAMQYSVNRGFRDYVEEREMRRLQQLAAAFTIAYAQHRNWDFVRESEDEWRRLRGSDRPTRVRRGGEPPASSPAPDRLPTRPDDPFDPRRSDGERQRGAPLPLTLLDAQRKIVRGSALRPSGPALSVPVMIDGAAVGFVAVPELPYGGDDDQFLRQQLRMSWIIGGVAILLAAGVSVLLARGFLAPIRRLARATHRLAAGDYAQRISVDRRDELGQLVDDFNAMAATLARAETARRSFLADVSHELRTPLAILRGELEALQDGVRSLSPEALKSLQAEVGALAALVDDLHELADADIGRAQYERRDVDIAGLLRATLYAFRERFAARALDVDTTGVPAERVVVVGDARRLTQLFNNLFENTLRYTDEGGRIEVGLQTPNDDVELDVRDSAPGVAEHLLPRLFERLFRVEASRNRALGGRGLGLALCRSIVEMHGGDIRASASALGGLRIVVRLPRAGCVA